MYVYDWVFEDRKHIPGNDVGKAKPWWKRYNGAKSLHPFVWARMVWRFSALIFLIRNPGVMR